MTTTQLPETYDDLTNVGDERRPAIRSERYDFSVEFGFSRLLPYRDKDNSIPIPKASFQGHIKVDTTGLLDILTPPKDTDPLKFLLRVLQRIRACGFIAERYVAFKGDYGDLSQLVPETRNVDH